MNETNNGRSIAAVLAELKRELLDSFRTRLELLKTECQEKLKILKVAAPLAAAGLVLLGTAYLLFTMALVGLAVAFLSASPYRWFFAFLIVGGVWALLGGVAVYFAKREFEMKALMPRRIIDVLRDDKVWIQAEVKNQI